METALGKILVVDDDIHINSLITRFLQKRQYDVEFAHDGKTGRKKFESFQPDLVILDINLPDTLGYNLCQEMQGDRDVFVLMLTSRGDVEDKKKGFLLGADDYLTKPFDLEELEFRIQAILRRRRVSTSNKTEILHVGDILINPKTREVKIDEELINLTSLEFDLLFFLASHPHRVWTRDDLVYNVWHNNPIGDNRVVDVHIGQIRRKIEIKPHQSYITTIRRVGYKFNYQTT